MNHTFKARFIAKVLDINARFNVVLLNAADALENGVYASERVVVESPDGKQTVAYVDTTTKQIKRGEIGIFIEAAAEIGVRSGDITRVTPAESPASIELIRKKMDGGILSELETKRIITETMEKKLSDVELASYITSVYIRGLNTEETVSLTKAIVESGQTLDLGPQKMVVDKHCTGGVAGNRTTMLLVPIVAAAGLYIPKTSSRSITSASGTADTMEVLSGVEFSIEEMRRIVLKTHGCVVWGGGINLAAADDKLIQIRHPMRLDPKQMMVASVLAKKKSVGANCVVIDIPVGRGVKIPTVEAANELAHEFIVIGEKLGMKTEVLITSGRDPVGLGIGPGLECRDVLNALSGDGPDDLAEKSCRLAGAVLELSGKVEPGRGFAVASDLLKSGKALKKMREIIGEQGGNPNIKIDDLPIGKYTENFYAEKDGRIHIVDNRKVNMIARAAGAPRNKGAGVLLNAESGDKVKKGELLYTIVAETESQLSFAIDLAKETPPIELEAVILEKVARGGTFVIDHEKEGKFEKEARSRGKPNE